MNCVRGRVKRQNYSVADFHRWTRIKIKTSADHADFRRLSQKKFLETICVNPRNLRTKSFSIRVYLCPSVIETFFLLEVSGRNSRISPGWQSSVSQIASSVEKRMALALPVLRMDRFCGVMSTALAKSFSRILRCARTTSKLTMMGINLNRQFLFLLQFLRFLQKPCDKNQRQASEQTAETPSLSNFEKLLSNRIK